MLYPYEKNYFQINSIIFTFVFLFQKESTPVVTGEKLTVRQLNGVMCILKIKIIRFLFIL
jgi:hypothetical protein